MKKYMIPVSFIYQNFSLLPDLILSIFDSNEAVQMIKNFLDTVSRDSAQISKKYKFIMFRNLFKTEFMRSEKTRAPVLKSIMNSLISPSVLDTNTLKDQTVPLLFTIFFLLMHTSDLSSALSVFQPIIPILSDASLFGTDKIPQRSNNLSPHYSLLILLLYFMQKSTISEAITFKPENSPKVFTDILDSIKTVVQAGIPTQGETTQPLPQYIFAVTSVTFIKLVTLTNEKSFTFIKEHISGLIIKISEFYSIFLKAMTNYNDVDRSLMNSLYSIDLEPIAALLPELLHAVDVKDRFNAGVILPLFHFYVNQRNEQTRNSVAEGFYLVSEADYLKNGKFFMTENSSIHAMDKVSSVKTAKEDLKSLFNSVACMYNAQKKIPPADVEHFVKRLSELADCIADIGQIPDDRLHEDERAQAIVNVLDSCTSNNDFELFPHFSSKLFELHVKLENWVEAAETLVECAKLFKYDDHEMLAEGHGHKEQEKGERKLSIMLDAAILFMKASFYERARDVLLELLDYYSSHSNDYLRIGEIYKQLSECYEKMTQERNILNRFYGVRFYGTGFDPNFDQYFANKLFVYRRNGFYMNDQMMRELTEKFPKAKVDPRPPSEEDKEKQYIHIFNMDPPDIVTFSSDKTPSEVMVEQVSGIDTFSWKTPKRVKDERTKQYGEFAEWHRIIVTYKTAEKLQGRVRRSEVIESSRKEELKTPVECAVMDTNAKTLELMRQAFYYWRCKRYDIKFPPEAISNFTMLITGIVNAAVNGGTAVFQQIFLESDLAKEAEIAKHAPSLIDAFKDQLKAVFFALVIHEKIVPEVNKPLHQNACENFKAMVEKMKPAIDKDNTLDLHTYVPTFGEVPDLAFLDPVDPLQDNPTK